MGTAIGWFTRNPDRKELESVVEETEKRIVVALHGKKKYFLKRFPELSKSEKRLLGRVIEEFQGSEARASGKSIAQHLKKHCIENLIELDREQKGYLLRILEHCLMGFGALDDILGDKAVEEIALIGIKKPVFVFHRRHGWLETNLFFESSEAVRNTVNRMAQNIGRRLTMQTPLINAVLPDGSRMHAAMPPLAFSGPCFTIRKFLKEFFTPVQLVRNGTLSVEAAAFLWLAVESNCSILVAGNTGSGKTTTLNALFCFVPREERIIVVEETPEIVLPHKHVVKLNVVEEQKIGMQNLIIQTLRMRPDRVVVGEVRSKEEMRAFIDTLLAGQGKACCATFHGQSSEEVLKRALSMSVLPLDLAAIDLVVVQRRWDKVQGGERKEMRCITEISEFDVNGNSVAVRKLFEFDFARERLVRKNSSVVAVKKMQRCFSGKAKELGLELKRRELFLKGVLNRELSLKEFFEKVHAKAWETYDGGV